MALFLHLCTLVYGVTRETILHFLIIYAKVIYMSTEGTKKLHDSIRIPTCEAIKKNYRDLLQRGYLGVEGIFICI